MQDSSKVTLSSCSKSKNLEGLFFIRGGSIIAGSTKRPIGSEIDTLRSDFDADLVFYGAPRSLLASQERARAMKRALRKERGGEEIFFLQGARLGCGKSGFLI